MGLLVLSVLRIYSSADCFKVVSGHTVSPIPWRYRRVVSSLFDILLLDLVRVGRRGLGR